MGWLLSYRSVTLFPPSITKIFSLSSRLKSTGLPLSYKIIGDTLPHSELPPVLMLHGFLGQKKHMNSIGKTILNLTKRAVITVDLRNHGNSPHDKSHQYEDLAADIMELYEKMSIQSASLVGHSMGGRAAMCVSLLHPEKVTSLIIMDISPISSPACLVDTFPNVLTAMKIIDFRGQKNVEKAKRMVKRNLRKLVDDEYTLRAIMANVRVNNDGTIGWACNLDALIKQFNYIASFPDNLIKLKYHGPALFIGGGLSDFLPADDLSGIREMFPQAVVKYIPKTGHNFHAQEPRTFLELAIAFLRVD